MSVTDIIIVIIFAGAVVLGYRKGVIRQAGSLCGVVGGILACRSLGDKATALATEWLGADVAGNSSADIYVASVVGNVALFLLVWFGIWVFSLILRKAVHTLFLGPVDGIAGSAFMAFKWFLVMSLLLNLYKIGWPDSPLFESSRLFGGEAFRAIIGLAPWLWGLVMPTN